MVSGAKRAKVATVPTYARGACKSTQYKQQRVFLGSTSLAPLMYQTINYIDANISYLFFADS